MLVGDGLHRPSLDARVNPEAHERRRRTVRCQLRFLRPALTLHTVFLEVDAGDCALSHRISGYVERVYAVDPAAELLPGRRQAPNLVPLASDGVSIPLPDDSIDVAFCSRQPADAAAVRARLVHVYRALVPGGAYFCIDAHRLCGGQHTVRALRRLLLGAGFRDARFYAGARGYYVPMSAALLELAERALEALPPWLRKLLAGNAPARAFLGIYARAVKPR